MEKYEDTSRKKIVPLEDDFMTFYKKLVELDHQSATKINNK